MDNEVEEKTLPSTKPPESAPFSPPMFTPKDYADALAGEFKALRADFTAQVTSVAGMLEESVMARLDRHMEREEETQQEIAESLRGMKADVSQLVANYHRVNRDVGEHSYRIAALEGELHTLKIRMDGVLLEISQIKETMVE